MATFTWQALSGGAFDNGGNWNAGSVPGTTDTALLYQNGGALSGAGSVDTLTFAAAAWVISGGDLTTTTATIDNSVVSVSGGTSKLTVNGALLAGRSGSVTLVVANSGRLVTTTSASGAASTFGPGSVTIASGGIATFGGPLVFGASGATTATVDAAVLAVGGVLQLGISGGSGSLLVQNGAQVALTAAGNSTLNSGYLQVGAVAGSTGTVQVSGANSILLVASNGGVVGLSGTGLLTVSGRGSVRLGTANNPLDPALAIGRFGSGTVTVTGAGSSLVATGTITVGVAGSGTLRITAGASATSATVASSEAALAVASAGGQGTLVVDGAGSQLVASGQAVVGGDNRGSGFTTGGSGTVAITNGGFLQTGAMTILAGSSVTIDGASREVIGGTLTTSGTLTSYGTLQVTGAVTGSGTLQVAGGVTDVGALAAAAVSFASANATLFVRGVSGTSTIANMQYGDRIDLVGNTSVRLSGTTVTTASGTITLGAAPADADYALSSDGNGGTYISITSGTIGVYRFFDSNYGTHFFSSSISEKDTIIGTRPDLVYEGVGLESIDPSSSDPNAAPVYRFFDSTYGTHFFTASMSERNTVIATRSDLTYEGTGFTEHTVQQTGDTAVYRFFDTKFGTHFYTADATERATVIATRPDLVDEGIGFYAPQS